LHWTPYADFPGATAGYRIYRQTNSGGNSEVLTQLPSGVLTFEDDVSNMLLSPGDFCYIIEATDANAGPDGAINYALSNKLCLTQEPVIWVPNAMLVGGYNDEFKPVISFADFANYRLDIINRWGDLMFTTTEVANGWDGQLNGEPAPEGAYGYFITIQDGSGRIFEEQGMMILLISE
jgi:gliding motility-associated-like protein